MSEEKKIIIDEDWKSQVEAEKETLAKGQEEQPEAPAGAEEMPPASFEMLLTSLATEAMMSLGQMPTMTGQPGEVSIPHARYAIDMLQMIQEKTQGNLTPAEEQAIEGLLHQLRMMFVSVEQGQSPVPPMPGNPLSGGA
jgi:hypothetical protein